jgi:hypothetical protein
LRTGAAFAASKPSAALAPVLTLALVLAFVLAGCGATGGGGASAASLPDDAQEALAQCLDAAAAELGDDNAFPPYEIGPFWDTEALGDGAASAASALPENPAIPFAAALVRCGDAAAAADMKQRIADLVTPGDDALILGEPPAQKVVLDAGGWVLYAAGSKTQTDTLLLAFVDAASGGDGETVGEAEIV